jgi:membrane protease YdiL (CAAX protease family)
VALVSLWAARPSASPRRARFWTVPFAVALVAALASRIVDVRGVVVLFLFAVTCRAANRARGRGLQTAAHLLMFGCGGALLAHLAPGFDNPRVIDDVVLSPGGLPYTKYLNFDKAAAGLFLLGIYMPEIVAADDGFRQRRAFAWRFALMVAATIALALAIGFVRWDPKMPQWFAAWAASLLLFTALPEEALFRGAVQTPLQQRLGTAAAIVIAAALFGIAHAAGGPPLILLATVAGAGYGWIYAESGSIGAAIAAHAGLDVVHFLFFTYPALALH